MTDEIFTGLLQYYANKIVEDAKKSIASLHVPAVDYGGADIDYVVSMNGTKITITASGWRFFMSEFGKGSLLDRENPWLADYVASEMFNKMRVDKNYAILSRVSGANLEAKLGVSKPEYLPFDAQHFLEEAIETYIPEMLDDIIRIVTDITINKLVNSIPKQIQI